MGPISAISALLLGQNLTFGELVQAGDSQLNDDNHQYPRCDLEELPQVDANRTPDETHPEQDRQRKAEHDAHRGHNPLGVQTECAEEQHRFHALAEDHQENEEEDAPLAARLTAAGAELRLDFRLQVLAVPIHPDDHAEDEYRADQHRPAAIGFLSEIQLCKDIGGNETRDRRGSQSAVDGGKEFEPAGFLEVSDRNCDNKRRFHPFTKGDYERLQHTGPGSKFNCSSCGPKWSYIETG